MYQMKKYTSPGLIPHRPQTMSYQERPSMYGAHLMSGELSPTDPKPRLRWTAELHERFVDAVNQLGGADSKLFLQSFLLQNHPRTTVFPSKILTPFGGPCPLE